MSAYRDIISNQYARINYAFWILTVSLIGWIKFFHHDLWKDEWQAWFVAKDKSVSEILAFLYYEGHPALWYLYLKIFTPLQGLMGAEHIIGLAHLITVAAGLYVFFLKFRMHSLLKVLAVISYFLFFEYGVINRGYFLVVLFAFLATYFLRSSKSNATLAGLSLMLLCQTEVYGVMIAAVLVFYDYLTQRSNLATQNKPYKINFLALKGFLIGLGVFVICVFPRTAGHVASTRGRELSAWDSFLTAFQGNLSNTYLLGSTGDTSFYGWTGFGILISIFVVLGLYLIFKKTKTLGFSMLVFVCGMTLFSILFFMGGVRQWGMGFVMFLCLLELRNINFQKDTSQMGIAAIILAFATIHNAKALKATFSIPFTNAKMTGEFIKEKVPEKVPVLAINKFEATPVIGYTGRSFYELPTGDPFTYFRWVDKIYLPTEGELKLFAKFKKVGGIVILTPTKLDANRYPNVVLWQQFDKENYKNENYYLYTLALKPIDAQ